MKQLLINILLLSTCLSSCFSNETTKEINVDQSITNNINENKANLFDFNIDDSATTLSSSHFLDWPFNTENSKEKMKHSSLVLEGKAIKKL